MKRCSKCGVEKDESEFYRRKGGVTYACKDCDRAYRAANIDKRRDYLRAYNEANREKILEKKRDYHKATREKLYARKREYYEHNRDSIIAKTRAYYEANRDTVLVKVREYRKANLEKIRAYRDANREKIRNRMRGYCATNRGRIQETALMWREAHPERCDIHNARKYIKRTSGLTEAPEELVNAVVELRQTKRQIKQLNNVITEKLK